VKLYLAVYEVAPGAVVVGVDPEATWTETTQKIINAANVLAFELHSRFDGAHCPVPEGKIAGDEMAARAQALHEAILNFGRVGVAFAARRRSA
jgi:hypothetical protein